MSKQQEYAEVKAQIKELTDKESVLKQEIIEDMESKGLSKDETEFGTFSIASKKTYTYSDKVNDLAEKVKIAKHKEEQKGIATIKTDTRYMIYKPA